MSGARWIFLRAYLLVALLVVVTGLGLEQLLENRDVQALAERESALLRGGFVYAATLPVPSTEQARALLAQSLSAELQLPARIVPLSDFQQLGKGFDDLQAGEILRLFSDGDRAIFYRVLVPDQWVLALGPAPGLGTDQMHWVVPVFYGCIALAVFLWIRPLMRDLEVLQQSALSFGRQDFSTRVTIPSRSWLAPLGDAFNTMAVRIQWLLQSHRELTHAVSHELRTPLARLRFSLEMLHIDGRGDSARHKNSMNRDIEELNTLIDEMLSYAELDQEHLCAKSEPLELSSWLETYVSAYNQATTGIAVSLALPKAKTVALADSRLLQRALDNLVGNAQRYAGGSILVRLSSCDFFCQIQVEDDGPGIPLEKRAAVMSAFTRLEPEQGGVSHGFGLGLAIVKRVMDLHAGEVIIETSAKGGAQIALRWPP